MTQQWEYKLLAERDRKPADVEAELNQLGAEGSEVVAFVGYERLDSIVLKRPIRRPTRTASHQ